MKLRGSVSEEDGLALSVFRQRRLGERLQVGEVPANHISTRV